MSLLRSVTVVGDPSPSQTVDRSFQSHNSTNENTLDQTAAKNKTEAQLRTFRGSKRNTVH